MSSNEANVGRAPFLNRLFDLPDVSASDGLRWVRPANHMQRRVARGGALYMNAHQLGFRPRGIDTLFGARAVTWELASITDIELKPTLRKLRITITTAIGKERFIVSNPEVAFNELKAWQEGHGGQVRPVRTAPPERGGTSA